MKGGGCAGRENGAGVFDGSRFAFKAAVWRRRERHGGGRRPSAEGRPRPPSTRCAPSGAHAPKMLILLSKQFAAAVFDLKKKQGYPCFSDEKYYFPNAAAVTRFIFSTKAAASGIGLPSNRIAWSSSREAMSLCNSSEAFSNASRIG